MATDLWVGMDTGRGSYLSKYTVPTTGRRSSDSSLYRTVFFVSFSCLNVAENGSSFVIQTSSPYFWSGIVFGDSLTIEYMPDGASAKEAVPFQIVEISHIWDDAFGGGGEADVQPPIAAAGGALGQAESIGRVRTWTDSTPDRG